MKKIFIYCLIVIFVVLNTPVNMSYAHNESIDINIDMNTALGNIYEKGSAGFFVQVSNRSGSDQKLDVNYSVTGITYENDSFSVQDFIEILSDEDKKFSFSFPQEKYGMYRLNVSVAGTADFSADFAVIPHYEKQFLEEYTRRGIATQYERGGRTDGNDRILMEKAGVRHIRDGVIWSKHEKSKGVFDYSYTDSWYEDISGDMHSLVMGLWYNNPLYNGNKSDKYGVLGQYQIEAYANYARNMARRYRDVSEFEIWNEPDYGSFWLPEGNAFDYVNLLKTAAVEIKQINSKAAIAAGALARTSETNFIKQVFAFGGYPYFDAVSVHPYVSPQYDADDEYSLSRYESYTDLISEYGGWKDIIATEVGWPTHSGGATLKRQAEQLVKQNIIADKFGFYANEWFSFRDAGKNAGNKEDNFGILKNDYTPKPAYFALCAVNQFLAGAVYCGEASWLTGAEGHLYMKDGNPVLVAWTETQPVSVTELGDNIEAFDIYANKCTDASSLPTDGSPVYFVNVDYAAADRVLLEKEKAEYLAYLQKYENYLSQESREDIAGFINNLERIGTDINETEDRLNAHYSCGIKMIHESNPLCKNIELLSGMLYDWHRIGETIAKQYLQYDIAQDDVNYDAKHEIRKMNYSIKRANKDHETDGFPFSQSIARFAERCCDAALNIRNMEANKMKYSYSKMCNDISRNLAIMAENLLQVERGKNSLILISAPSKGLVLKGGASKIYVTVKNYKKNPLEGTLCLYASDGTPAASSDTVTFIPLISQEIEMEISSEFYNIIADGAAQLRLKQGENTVACQKIILINKGEDLL